MILASTEGGRSAVRRTLAIELQWNCLRTMASLPLNKPRVNNLDQQQGPREQVVVVAVDSPVLADSYVNQTLPSSSMSRFTKCLL